MARMLGKTKKAPHYPPPHNPKCYCLYHLGYKHRSEEKMEWRKEVEEELTEEHDE